MNIQVLGYTELKLFRFDLDELKITLENDVERYSAMAMFITSLARCTVAILEHHAMRMDISTKNVITHLSWDLTENPTRINQINMKIYWPELPEKRISSVERASHKCIISNTIKDCIKINTSVINNNYQ